MTVSHNFEKMVQYRNKRTFRKRRPRRRTRRRPTMNRKLNIALARSKPEKKHWDVTFSGAVVTTPVVVDLEGSGIFQGDDSDQRIGNQLYYRNCDIKARYIADGSSTVNSTIRVVIVKFFSDALPTWLEVMNEASTLSHYKKGYAGKFKILKDYLCVLSAPGIEGSTKNRSHIVRIASKQQYAISSDLHSKNQRYAAMFIADVATFGSGYNLHCRWNYYDQ